jgi:hypothetical protein
VVGRVGVLCEVVVEVGLEIAAPEVLLERLLVGDGERVDEGGAFGDEVLERLLGECLDLGVSGWRVDVGAVADARGDLNPPPSDSSLALKPFP